MSLSQILRKEFTSYIKPLFIQQCCECCGCVEHLHLHHVVPFKILLYETMYQLNLELHEDINKYTENELLLIKEIMLGKQLKTEYITCCKTCHTYIHFLDLKQHNTKHQQMLHMKNNIPLFEQRIEQRQERKRQTQIRKDEKQQKLIELKNKARNVLHIGQTYTYQQLCILLDEPYYTGGRSKKCQMEKWSQCFTWEYFINKRHKQTKKMTILEIF